MATHSITKGRHSELLAITALLAGGWSVSEPVVPEAFDILAIPPGGASKDAVRIQVKTARARTEPERHGWIVVNAKKNSGESYTLEDCDAFIAVLDGEVYYFVNREIGEYWCKAEELSVKWERLETTLDSLKIPKGETA